MIGSGRIVGLGLIIGSVVLLLGFIAWAVTAVVGSETSATGMVLGIFLALVVFAPIIGIGIYLLRRGQSEQQQFDVVSQEKKILNMVLAQGQVGMGELIGELGEPRDRVEEMIRNLVGKRLFSGAINWDKGILYSVESQQLAEGRHCPNCGGELEFAGKGIIACPYCGSEVFLTPRAAASTEDAPQRKTATETAVQS